MGDVGGVNLGEGGDFAFVHVIFFVVEEWGDYHGAIGVLLLLFFCILWVNKLWGGR